MPHTLRALASQCASFALMLVISLTARAQAVNPPQTTEDALRQLAEQAGIIFTGAVTAVRRPAPASPQAAGVVEIDFAVTDAIRGVFGSTFTLREWAGLWAANDQPFRPGQRFLMLLHTPNAAGFSSPVGGPDGAIPIRAAGASSTPTSQSLVTANSVAPGQQPTVIPDDVVDLGWIATHVVVPIPYSTSPAHATGSLTSHPDGPVSVANAAPVATANAAPTLPASPSGAGVPAALPEASRAVPYPFVLATLRASRPATR